MQTQVKNPKPIPITCLIISYILLNISYYLSLQGCDKEKSQSQCVQWVLPKLTKLSILGIFSAATLTTIFWLSFLKKIPMFHIVIVLINFIIIVLRSQGTSLYSHGEYNLIFLCLILFLLNLIAVFVLISHKLYYYLGQSKAIVAFGVFYFVIPFAFYFIKIYNTCEGAWDVGFKNTRIDTNGQFCTIDLPLYCWYDILDGVQDISGWMGDTCDDNFGDFELTKEFYGLKNGQNINDKVLAFPRTVDWSHNDTLMFKFNQKVKERMIQNPEQQQKQAYITFEQGKPHIQLSDTFRNETIARAARQKAKEYQKMNPEAAVKTPKNVFWFYIDAVSRPMLARKMPKTYKWLQQWYRKERNPSQEETLDYQSFQFFRYHSLARFTTANLYPLDFGINFQSNSTQNKNYSQFFRDRGYVTAFAKNNCGLQDFDDIAGQTDHINKFNYDHSPNAIFCDPNYFDPINPYSNAKGPFSHRRRCLYGRDTYEYILDYSLNFWISYRYEKKFMKTHFSDHHEWTAQVIKYMDEKVFRFLNQMAVYGLFQDTALIVAADHGQHMAGILYLLGAQNVMMEMFFPMFYIVLPNKYSQLYRDVLIDNQQSFFTGWDIRKTLQYLAYGEIKEEKQSGSCLLTERIQHSIDCNDVKVQKPQECHCNLKTESKVQCAEHIFLQL